MKRNWKKIFLSVLILALSILFLYENGWQYQGDTRLDQVYMAKACKDGQYYILDQGHTRLSCVKSTGQLRYQLKDPEDTEGQSLYIDDFCADEEGNLYIQASIWDGMHLSGEEILLYRNGKLKSVIKERDYSEEWVNKHQILGISSKDGNIQYSILSENDIQLYSWSSQSGEKLLYTKDYTDAADRISDCVIKDEEIWILDRNGTIHKVCDNQDEIVFNVEKSEFSNGIPYKFAMDEKNQIYYTDIKNRMIVKVDEMQYKAEVAIKDTDSGTVSISEQDEKAKLLTADAEKVVITDQKGNTDLTMTVMKNSIVRKAGWWFAAVYIAGFVLISMIYLILHGIRAVNHSLSVIQRVGLMIAAMMLMVSVSVSGLLIKEFSKSYREKISEQIETAAYMISGQLGDTRIDSIQTAADYDGDAYQELIKTMKNAFSHEIEFYQQIYCNILTVDEDSNAYAVAYLDQSIGDYYPLDEVETEEVKEIYKTGKAVWNDGKEDISGSYLYVKVPIKNEKDQITGVAAVGTELVVIKQLIRKITENILSVLVILVLLFGLLFEEVISFLDARNKNSQAAKSGEPAFPLHWMRLIIFGVFAAYNMTASFLPVYIMRYSRNIHMIDPELAGSLPVTLNIFVIGAASLLCQSFTRKMGIRKLAVLSGISSFLGNMLIFCIPSYSVILAGLILDGIGVGFMTNAVYILISRILDTKCRIEGLTVYNGAYLAGLNFGVMLGSLLAVQFGQRIVFFAVAGVWIFLSVVIFVKGGILERGLTKPKETIRTDLRSVRKFILNRTVDSFILFMQNPYIIFGSFVFYFVPLFCDNAGYTELVSTLLLLLYAEIPFFLGERITDIVMKKSGYRSMYVAYGANILAVLIFAFYPHMAGMLAALILMGLSACFGKAVQQMYFLDLKEVQQFGADKAMGVYNFTENIGESLGPVIFGSLMFRTPLLKAILPFSSVMVLVGGLHYLSSRKAVGKDPYKENS